MPDWVAQFMPALAGAVFAGGGAYYGVRVHLYYMRRDLDRLAKRLDRLEHTAPDGSLYRGIAS